MKTSERKLYGGMTWATCLYEYRFRIEQNQDVDCPWGKDGWEGWLATIDNPRNGLPFQDFASGEHNPDRNETILYREIVGGWCEPNYLLHVSMGDLRKKYSELMGGTCNRKALIAWADKNLDAEEKTVRQYLDGEVYGFIVERKPFNAENPFDDGDKEWDRVDSCWGFYGSNPMENGMSELIDPMSYVKEDFAELHKREHDKIQKTADLLRSARD